MINHELSPISSASLSFANANPALAGWATFRRPLARALCGRRLKTAKALLLRATSVDAKMNYCRQAQLVSIIEMADSRFKDSTGQNFPHASFYNLREPNEID